MAAAPAEKPLHQKLLQAVGMITAVPTLKAQTMKSTLGALSLSFLFIAACGDADNDAATGEAHDTVAASPATPPPSHSSPMHQSMDKMMADLKALPLTGDADHDFAAIMRSHHQGAVVMMQEYLPNASDSMLRGMAEKGINDQQREVDELSAFLNSHKPTSQNSDYGKNAVQMIMDMMKMDAMPQNADKAFATMMIPHHESAVHISQMYGSQGKDAKMKEMASKIATEQQAEADAMKQWLQSHP